MRTIISSVILIGLLALPLFGCEGKIEHAKTETVKIYGNCGMCKETIEEAAYKKKEAMAEWNIDSKMAIITFDSTKTNLDAILKRIAQAGYDSDEFLATETAYNNLHQCCKYDRKSKLLPSTEPTVNDNVDLNQDTIQNADESAQINIIFDRYLELKDALVKTDGSLASLKAKSLLEAIEKVDMSQLSPEIHTVWMNIVTELKKDCTSMTETKNIETIRQFFIRLSKNMYSLIKVAKYDEKVFYQFCPMANNGKGANWLSKENAIKNPYYGNQMLTCGSTKETIE
jgi:hypothetical protein